MSMAANPIASDEGSDLEIEEVEVLNPLDLSVEDVYDSNDNVNENYQVHEEHQETETNASVDEDIVRVPVMNNQIGSEHSVEKATFFLNFTPPPLNFFVWPFREESPK